MAVKLHKGVYQDRLADGRQSAVYRMRRVVPADVRATIGQSEWDVSLDTTSAQVALARAVDLYAEWTRRIAQARSATLHPPLDLNHVAARIDEWEAFCRKIDLASPYAALIRYVPLDTRPAPWRRLNPAEDPQLREAPERRTVTLETPAETAHRIALVTAAVAARRYSTIPAWTETLVSALKAGEIEVSPTHPLWEDIEAIFAPALLRMLLAREQARIAAAAQHIARYPTSQPAIQESVAASVQVIDVAKLIESYTSDRSAIHGAVSTMKKYGHLFRALEEALGPQSRLETITPEDCRRVREILRKLPSNASKKFPGLSLKDAIAAADDSTTPVPRLSPNTLNTYLANLSAVMNWAVKERWLANNPAAGLVEADRPMVVRRGFTAPELNTLFSHLEPQRGSSLWWITALGLFSGARMGELAQLLASDVRVEQGITYIAISEFDDDGSRNPDKSLKTDSSRRNIPIHPDLIAAGFVAFAESRRGKRLFELSRTEGKTYSHNLSRWFSNTLVAAGIKDKSLVYHSFRHGFRDACETAEISERLTKALGGWAATSISQKYGTRGAVPLLRREVDKLKFGLKL